MEKSFGNPPDVGKTMRTELSISMKENNMHTVMCDVSAAPGFYKVYVVSKFMTNLEKLLQAQR
jgi:hypothetical protein